MKQGDRVWVSDFSEENAVANKSMVIFLCSKPGTYMYITQSVRAFEEGEPYGIASWKYAVPVPKKRKETRVKSVNAILRWMSEQQVKVSGAILHFPKYQESWVCAMWNYCGKSPEEYNFLPEWLEEVEVEDTP